jgi:hypothetical protein
MGEPEDEDVWKRALARAGVIFERKPGESYAGFRENGAPSAFSTACRRKTPRQRPRLSARWEPRPR